MCNQLILGAIGIFCCLFHPLSRSPRLMDARLSTFFARGEILVTPGGGQTRTAYLLSVLGTKARPRLKGSARVHVLLL